MKDNEIKTGTCLIEVPDNAIQLKIIATIIDKDLKQHQAEMILELPEIIESRISGEEWHMENDVYVLTDKALKEFEDVKDC